MDRSLRGVDAELQELAADALASPIELAPSVISLPHWGCSIAIEVATSRRARWNTLVWR
ncbi:MAG TPA: hypothetical protein VNZ26_23305 [Vicinamibacterales bacterium]|nr:hypothetical protein [Vicinamibacterales bacterium]